jgi:nitrogen fixation/metabolism regulation signal transduction histidine kinase
MRPVRQALQRVIVFALLGLVLVVCIILYVSFRLTEPIGKLMITVRELGKGNLDTQVTGVRSGDELEDLARVFNLVIRQLKVHMQKVTQTREQRQASGSGTGSVHESQDKPPAPPDDA